MAEKIDVIDLFCGCGGLSAGFVNYEGGDRFRLLGGIDLDAHACNTFSTELGAPALVENVTTMLTPQGRNSILKRWHPRGRGPLVVVGGPPCQGFSAHRKKDSRTDDRNNLVRVFVEVAVSLDPEFIVMENVPEIFDDKHWESAQASIKYLEECGYRVRAGVHNLADFGVPQARFRAVLIARRAGRAFNMPVPRPGRHRTVRDAIGSLPALLAGEASVDDPMHIAPNHIPRVLELIRSIPKDGGSRRSANLELLPNCHGQVDGFRDVYGRLAWDRPSISITAKCSTPSCGRFLHPEQDRNISVREAALLQGFPANFKFSGPFIQRYRQIGNAVSPIFAEEIARQIAIEIRQPSEVIEGAERDIRNSQGRSFTSSIAGRKRSPRDGQKGQLTALDFFAGAGGLSLGLRRAGFDVRYAFDFDPDAVRTYQYNLGSHIEAADALRTDPIALMARLGLAPGDVDLLAGGPPCQGFSQQRRGLDQDARNDLVLWYARAIALIQPRAFLLENVPYIAAKRGREVLGGFLEIVEGAGYAVTRAIVDASDYGVPQRRQRFVAIGYRDGPEMDVSRLRSSQAPQTSVRDAIGGLPSPPSHEDGEHPSFANHIGTRISDLNKLRISLVPEGGGWKDLPQELQLACHQNHRGHGHLDVFGRLSWNGLAQTITAHSDSFSRGRYAHPVEDRPLTGRELAALQSFPTWYRFVADKKSVARLVGNAVPPVMAEAIGTVILRELNSPARARPSKRASAAKVA